MKLTKTQMSAIIIFTVSLILFAFNKIDEGLIGIVIAGLILID